MSGTARTDRSKGEFETNSSNDGRYCVAFRAAGNRHVLMTSETHYGKRDAERCIELVRGQAADAEIDDKSVQLCRQAMPGG